MVTSALNISFGKRVRELRKAIGMTQQTFSDKSDLARSYVSKIEHGGGDLTLSSVDAIATALGVGVEALFEPARKRSPPAKVKLPAKAKSTAGVKPSVTLVPFAKDGSCFNPSLKRPPTKTLPAAFAVGEKGKGNTIQIEEFEDALKYLRDMPVAKWWRPPAVGAKDGLVSARGDWEPLPAKYHHLIT